MKSRKGGCNNETFESTVSRISAVGVRKSFPSTDRQFVVEKARDKPSLPIIFAASSHTQFLLPFFFHECRCAFPYRRARFAHSLRTGWPQPSLDSHVALCVVTCRNESRLGRKSWNYMCCAFNFSVTMGAVSFTLGPGRPIPVSPWIPGGPGSPRSPYGRRRDGGGGGGGGGMGAKAGVSLKNVV